MNDLELQGALPRVVLRVVLCQYHPHDNQLCLLRFGARLAEQVHEQAEGAGIAFGQLA